MPLPDHIRALIREFEASQSRPIMDDALVRRMMTESTTWMNATHMQHRRITAPLVDPRVPGEEVFRQEVDLHFMLVALTRLRRAVGVAARVDAVQDPVLALIVAFDEKAPGVVALRNVAEHFDDYTTGRGRQGAVRRGQLQTWSLGDEPGRGIVWRWLDSEFAVEVAHKAAGDLYAGFMSEARRFVDR